MGGWRLLLTATFTPRSRVSVMASAGREDTGPALTSTRGPRTLAVRCPAAGSQSRRALAATLGGRCLEKRGPGRSRRGHRDRAATAEGLREGARYPSLPAASLARTRWQLTECHHRLQVPIRTRRPGSWAHLEHRRGLRRGKAPTDCVHLVVGWDPGPGSTGALTPQGQQVPPRPDSALVGQHTMARCGGRGPKPSR